MSISPRTKPGHVPLFEINTSKNIESKRRTGYFGHVLIPTGKTTSILYPMIWTRFRDSKQTIPCLFSMMRSRRNNLKGIMSPLSFRLHVFFTLTWTDVKYNPSRKGLFMVRLEYSSMYTCSWSRSIYVSASWRLWYFKSLSWSSSHRQSVTLPKINSSILPWQT